FYSFGPLRSLLSFPTRRSSDLLDARFDDGFGLHHGRAARIGAALHQPAQVVDRIQIDVVKAADFGFDVARHGQVDHDHGAVAARSEEHTSELQSRENLVYRLLL